MPSCFRVRMPSSSAVAIRSETRDLSAISFFSGSLAISPTLYKKLPYEPSKDFAPIALVAKIPFFLVVNPSLPVRSVAELVKYAKDNAGKL